MHHILDFEKLKTDLEDKLVVDNTSKLQHLIVLLDFMRPKYEETCLAAQERLLQAQPTVSFEDVWFLMRPGTLAYTLWEDYWIGCCIKQASKLPNEQPGSKPERWVISVSFLQMSESTGDLRCVSTEIDIDYFSGERTVTNLRVFPRDFHDRRDTGARRKEFQRRGGEVARIIGENSRFMDYEGECLGRYERRVSGKSQDQLVLVKFTIWCIQYSGQVIVDGTHLVGGVGPPPYNWSLRNKDKANDTSEPLRMIFQRTGLEAPGGLGGISKTQNSPTALTGDHHFLISPFLYAFAITGQRWSEYFVFPATLTKTADWNIVQIHSGSLRKLTVSDHILEPLLPPEKHKVLNAIVESHLSPNKLLPSHSTGKGLSILLHGMSLFGKWDVEANCAKAPQESERTVLLVSYVDLQTAVTYLTYLESICMRLQRPLIVLKNEFLTTDMRSRNSDNTKKWLHLGERWRAIFTIQLSGDSQHKTYYHGKYISKTKIYVELTSY